MKHLFLVLSIIMLSVSMVSAKGSSREAKEAPSRTDRYTEDENGEEIQGFYFGASAGSILGSGIAFRYFPDNLGIQFTIAPFYINNTTLLEGGIGLFLKLHETEYGKFYLYTGASTMYSPNLPSDQQFMTYNIGAGYGLSWNLTQNIAFDASIGIAYYGLDNFSYMSSMFMIAGDCGIYYRF